MKYASIPYKGSKRDIAVELIEVMHNLKPQAKYFYDLFGGGGAITIAAIKSGYFEKVFYNEKDTAIFNLFKHLTTEGVPEEWHNWVSREQFHEVIASGYTSAYAGMIKCCWSFGNDCRTYLYGKNKELSKRLAHDMVVNKCEVALGELNKLLNIELKLPTGANIRERRLNFTKQIREHGKRFDLEHLEHLERLQRLQQLQQLGYYNLDYALVPIITPLEETIIYCDPPYRGTEKYAEGIDHSGLDEWFLNSPYTVFMSEYSTTHKLVWQIQKRVTLNSEDNRKTVSENLYWNGE